MPLGGPTGGLPDRAEGVGTGADDPGGPQGLEGREDFLAEAGANGLYPLVQRRDKLVQERASVRRALRELVTESSLAVPQGMARFLWSFILIPVSPKA